MLRIATGLLLTCKSLKNSIIQSKPIAMIITVYNPSFIYIRLNLINILEGSFTEGLILVPEIETKILEYRLKMDRHRILVFYYKIACRILAAAIMKAIEYLNVLLTGKLTAYRPAMLFKITSPIAHYELGTTICWNTWLNRFIVLPICKI